MHCKSLAFCALVLNFVWPQAAIASTDLCQSAFAPEMGPESLTNYAFEFGLKSELAQRASRVEGDVKDEFLVLVKARQEVTQLPKSFFKILKEKLKDRKYSESSRTLFNNVEYVFTGKPKSLTSLLWKSRSLLLDHALAEAKLALSDDTYDLFVQMLVLYPVIDQSVDMSSTAMEQRSLQFVTTRMTPTEKRLMIELRLRRGKYKTTSGRTLGYTRDARALVSSQTTSKDYASFLLKQWHHDFGQKNFIHTIFTSWYNTTDVWQSVLAEKIAPMLEANERNREWGKLMMRYYQYLLVDSVQNPIFETLDIQRDLFSYLNSLVKKLAEKFPAIEERPVSQTPVETRVFVSGPKANRPAREKNKEITTDASETSEEASRLTYEDADAMSEEEQLAIVQNRCLSASVYGDLLTWATDAETAAYKTVKNTIVLLDAGIPVREVRNIKPTRFAEIYEIKLKHTSDRIFFGLGSAGFKVLVVGDGVKQSRTAQNLAIAHAHKLWKEYQE